MAKRTAEQIDIAELKQKVSHMESRLGYVWSRAKSFESRFPFVESMSKNAVRKANAVDKKVKMLCPADAMKSIDSMNENIDYLAAEVVRLKTMVMVATEARFAAQILVGQEYAAEVCRRIVLMFDSPRVDWDALSRQSLRSLVSEISARDLSDNTGSQLAEAIRRLSSKLPKSHLEADVNG